MSFLDRKDETFKKFLKKYWWIEFLVIIKVIYFIDKGFYNIFIGFLVLLGGFVVLWILYRLGLE